MIPFSCFYLPIYTFFLLIRFFEDSKMNVVSVCRRFYWFLLIFGPGSSLNRVIIGST